jgi:hypothetical protein
MTGKLTSIFRTGRVMALCVALSAASARAGTVTYNFGGTVSSAYTDNVSLPTNVTTGAAFTGTLVYDDSAPVSSSSSIFNAYDTSLLTLNVNIAGTAFTSSTILSKYTEGSETYIELITNDPTGSQLRDSFIVAAGSYNYNDPNNQQNTAISLSLNDIEANPTALASDVLAGTTLDLSKFISGAQLQISDTSTNSGSSYNYATDIVGNITSLSMSSVPEPSSIIMGLLSLASFGGVSLVRRARHAA